MATLSAVHTYSFCCDCFVVACLFGLSILRILIILLTHVFLTWPDQAAVTPDAAKHRLSVLLADQSTGLLDLAAELTRIIGSDAEDVSVAAEVLACSRLAMS